MTESRKGAEPRDGLGYAGHRPVKHVEYAREQDHETSPEKQALGEQDGREDVDSKADKGQDIGVDAVFGKASDEIVLDPLTTLADLSANRVK